MNHPLSSVMKITVVVAVVTLAPTFALTWYLLSSGEQGATIATVLAIPMGGLTILTSIITAVAQHRLQQPAQHAGGRPWSGRAITVTIAAALLVGAVLPIGTWLHFHRYANLTVDFGKAMRLREDASTMIVPVVKRTPWRGDLTFVPKLAPTGTVGDCVLPAVLAITPIVDGQLLAPRRVRHDEEVSIPIPDGSGEVKLDVLLEVPGEQGCVVMVTLARGILIR